MSRLIRALCLLLCCKAAVAGQTINLATTDYPPYFSPALPNDGVVAAITRAALAKRGYSLQLHYRPWARLMAEVHSGQFDGVMAVWYQPERADYLQYSAPLVNTVIGFYARHDKPLEVAKLAALKPYVIGVVRGYKNPDAFDAAKLQVDPANDDLTNLKKLAAGRLDLVLIDKVLANSLLPALSSAQVAKIHWQDPPVAVMPLYVGFTRGRPDSANLTAEFNRGLLALHKSGEFAKLLQQYHLPQ